VINAIWVLGFFGGVVAWWEKDCFCEKVITHIKSMEERVHEWGEVISLCAALEYDEFGGMLKWL